MTQDDYRDDVSEDTEVGESSLSSADKAALDDAAADRGEDGTTAADLPEGEAAGAAGGAESDAAEEEAARANRLPGEQD